MSDTLYKQVELKDGVPVQYLGVYILKWRQEWGEPSVGFVPVEDDPYARIAALEAELADERAGCPLLAQATDKIAGLQNELEETHANLTAQILELQEANKATCLWHENSDCDWDTACGGLWEFMNDGPQENNVKYCCYCGKRIEIKRYERESKEE